MQDGSRQATAGDVQIDYGNLPEAESVAAAAKRAGVSRSFMYQRIATGELATIKIGKRRLVRPEALRAWLKRRERGGA